MNEFFFDLQRFNSYNIAAGGTEQSMTSGSHTIQVTGYGSYTVDVTGSAYVSADVNGKLQIRVTNGGTLLPETVSSSASYTGTFKAQPSQPVTFGASGPTIAFDGGTHAVTMLLSTEDKSNINADVSVDWYLMNFKIGGLTCAPTTYNAGSNITQVKFTLDSEKTYIPVSTPVGSSGYYSSISYTNGDTTETFNVVQGL